MNFFPHIHAFWQHRSLRLQLMIVIATIGLCALLLNAILLGTFLNKYILDRQGTQMEQQAEALSQWSKQNPRLFSNVSPTILARFFKVTFADSPTRRVIIMNPQGTLRYSTPMPQTLIQTLLTREQADLKDATPSSSSTTPQWELVGNQLFVDVRIYNVTTTGTSSQEHLIGVILLDEDQKIELVQWNHTLILILLSTAIAVVMILLGGILAAHVLARPLGEVTEVAQDISSGIYTRRVAPRGPAEIYTLGLSFNRMIDEVQHQQRVERDLLANISHELASPLGLIRGYAEALQDNVIDDDSQRMSTLRAISTETARLVRLSGDLLDLALLETGQIVVQYEPVPVHELLAGLYERFTPLAKRVEVHLTLDVPLQLPLIQTDGLRLEQVVVNLLNNALHYTPAHGTISIFASQVGDQLQLKVSDTGHGIAHEKLTQIWERFYQVDGARDRRTGAAGVGLGLAICRSIITQLNGHITVSSILHQGTTFTISLPITSSPLAKQELATVGASEARIYSLPLDKKSTPKQPHAY